MKRLLATVALGWCFAAPSLAAETPEQARNLLNEPNYSGAVEIYGSLVGKGADAGLVAEYAYALASAGFADLSLAELDRAFLSEPGNDEVRYFCSVVLAALGQEAAAHELARPAPVWLQAKGAIRPLVPERVRGDFKNEIASVNLLLALGRYVTASDRLMRLTREYPESAVAWAGYSLPLEKLGAYKTAAAAVAKDRELSKGDSEADVNAKSAHQSELEARPPFQVQIAPVEEKPKNSLKDRVFLFLGGNLSRYSEISSYSINMRTGRFITEVFDVAVDAGYTKGSGGLDSGGSIRWRIPLWHEAPLSLTAGSRIMYTASSQGGFSAIASPGISLFTGAGAIDISWDAGLQGPMVGTRTISAGYTAYFGGGTK